MGRVNPHAVATGNVPNFVEFQSLEPTPADAGPARAERA